MRLLVTLSLLFFCVVMDAENILVRDAPTLTYCWIGSAITAGASLIGGLLGNKSSSKNIDKQLAAQAEENQKTREYNLQLAQMQNAWNVEQWERENDYNTPANQLERMKAAGMNPDLAVANGYSNTSASSPQMSSGAAATAQDMSALGQKPTLGQAIQSALRDSMIGAQIDNIKAQTEKTRSETTGQDMANDVQRELKDFLGLDIKDVDGVNQYLFSPQAQKALYELRVLKSEASIKNNEEYNSDASRVIREMNYSIEKDISSKEWRTLSAQLDMSEQEAKEFVKNAVLRLRGLEADVSIKESEALWNSPDIIKNLPDGLPLLVKLLRIIIGK